MTMTSAEAFYSAHATPAELAAILGSRWALCRDTPANRERHGRCVTAREYRNAQRTALARRPAPK